MAVAALMKIPLLQIIVVVTRGSGAVSKACKPPQDMPATAISNVAGDSNYARVQVLTPAGVLDRDKQLGVVNELTEIIAAAADDPSLRERTWVLLTESPEGGWGIAGHANTSSDIAELARAAISSAGT